MIEFVVTCDSERTSDGGYKVIQSKELVRCKDCKYGKHIVSAFNGEVTIYRIFCSKRGNESHEPDWFCADGERKEER